MATLAEQFTGRTARTQFGRALEAAGIAWIAARSPQAKGRIERLWGTLQDRLVIELRLAGAATRDEANAVLATYLPRHNARFAVSPANPEPAWRPLPADRSPESLFCFTHPRRVARDGTVTLAGRTLMLLGQPAVPGWRGEVVVEERLDGSLWARVDGILHPVVPAPERPVFLRERATARSSAVRTPPPPRARPSRGAAILPFDPGDKVAGRLSGQSAGRRHWCAAAVS